MGPNLGWAEFKRVTVIDFGCGAGENTGFCSRGVHVTAIYWRFLVSSVLTLKFPERYRKCKVKQGCPVNSHVCKFKKKIQNCGG